MPQTREVRGVATSIVKDGPDTIVYYHSTDVVTFDADTVRLHSGGWRTATTKRRMNQAATQFNLGFTVYQRQKEWWVEKPGGTVPFVDGMTFKTPAAYKRAHV